MVTYLNFQKLHPPRQRWARQLAAIVLAGMSMAQAPGSWAQTPPQRSPKSITNAASYSYADPEGGNFGGVTNQLTQSLVDPLGQITGCNGELLSDYSGFSVGVYEVAATGFDLAGLTPLTQTEVPDIVGNGIPPGASPNRQNSNPYFIQADGRYNFLLDESRGQLAVGRAYIIVINTPPNSNYAQRRIKLVITGRSGNTASYTATSLDGKALDSTDGQTSVNGTLNIQDAEKTGLSIAVINVSASTCDAQEIQITKSGDRATAQPGDTVIYR